MGDREPSILFVCTGNIFRSMTAEYVAKAALGEEKRYCVGSAGTGARTQEMSPFVRGRLLALGIDAAGHRQRKIDEKMLAETDLVVAMGVDHVEHLRAHYQYEARLFNEVCYGRAEGLLDGWEAVADWQSNQRELRKYMEWVVDYIHESMPHFIGNMGGYLGNGSGQSRTRMI